MSQINIPISCPSCSGKMYAVKYDAILTLLQDRGWQICKECGFQRSTEDFKKELLSV